MRILHLATLPAFCVSIGCIVGLAGLAGLGSQAAAEEPAPAPAPAPIPLNGPAAAPAAADPDQTRHEASYQVGVQMGLAVKRYELDPADVARGIQDLISGKAHPLDPSKMDALMTTYQGQLAGRAKDKNAQYFADNAKKPGVKTLPDGVQYEVLASGPATGKTPVASDQVKVNYKGTFPDGTVFDASELHGGPATFGVGGVIKAWTDTLEAMKEGDKWRITVPSELGYGPNGNPPTIPPNQILVFEIELLQVLPAAAGAAPAPR